MHHRLSSHSKWRYSEIIELLGICILRLLTTCQDASSSKAILFDRTKRLNKLCWVQWNVITIECLDYFFHHIGYSLIHRNPCCLMCLYNDDSFKCNMCNTTDKNLFTAYVSFWFTPQIVNSIKFDLLTDNQPYMCTTMIKEIASYYNSRHTDIFFCTVDASKTFDRVHLGKLFALLHNRGLPPVANRLLLDMYTRQRMCTTWNGVKSEFFATENGVKQGGILSPILLVYTLMNCWIASSLRVSDAIWVIYRMHVLDTLTMSTYLRHLAVLFRTW